MWRWLVLVLAACGRIGFDVPVDPEAGTSSDEASGDGASGDGTSGDGASGDGATVDGAPSMGDVCANAIDLQLEVPYSGTVAMASDDYGGGLCGNGVEVVFRFNAPAEGLRAFDIDAMFDGAIELDDVCPLTSGGCQSFSSGFPISLMQTATAGVNYFYVERISGTGTQFSLTVR